MFSAIQKQANSPRFADLEGWNQFGLLVVEDEQQARNGLSSWLRKKGFHVRTAKKGIEAIRNARQADVHIVLLDIMMPGRYDGLEAAQRIQAENPDKVILFVTAYNNQDSRRRALDLDLQVPEWAWVDKLTSDEDLGLLGEALCEAIRELTERRKKKLRLICNSTEGTGLKPAQVFGILKLWDPGLSDQIVSEVNAEPDLVGKSAGHLISELLDLIEGIQILFSGESNIQTRQMAFGPFKEIILDQLWETFEGASKYHRQIALQVRMAVRRLNSLEMERGHLEALAKILSILAKSEIVKDDVRLCERTLRYSGIETLVELGKQREELLDIYHQEGEPDNGDPE